MNFLADENVDRPVVERLRRDGHSVFYVAESAASSSDEEVIRLVSRSSAVLLTADKDFGELFFRQRRVEPGVVLLRLSGLSALRKAELVSSAVAAHAKEIERNFTVVTPGAVRVRKSPQ